MESGVAVVDQQAEIPALRLFLQQGVHSRCAGGQLAGQQLIQLQPVQAELGIAVRQTRADGLLDAVAPLHRQHQMITICERAKLVSVCSSRVCPCT